MQAGRSTLALVEMPLIAKNTYAPVASATNFMVGSRAQPPFKRLPLRARANRAGQVRSPGTQAQAGKTPARSNL